MISAGPDETSRYHSDSFSNGGSSNSNGASYPTQQQPTWRQYNNPGAISDDSVSHTSAYYDYAERRPVDVAIPDHGELKTSRGEKYVVFNINLNGRRVCSRRYKEFDVFASLLRHEFADFNGFPSLPTKWPFKLSEQQLDARRRGLETFLQKSLYRTTSTREKS